MQKAYCLPGRSPEILYQVSEFSVEIICYGGKATWHALVHSIYRTGCFWVFRKRGWRRYPDVVDCIGPSRSVARRSHPTRRTWAAIDIASFHGQVESGSGSRKK